MVPCLVRSLAPQHVRRPLPATIVAFVASAWLGLATAQSFPPSMGLAGPVRTVERYQEYPGTTDRRLVLTRAYAEDGTPVELVTYAYSYMDGSLTARNVTSYDDGGRPLAVVQVDAEENPIGQTIFRYDDAQRLVEEVRYDAEGNEVRRVAYERDHAGNPVVEEVYANGALSRRTERTFDAAGDAVEEREFDGEGRLTEVGTFGDGPDGRVREFVSYDEDGEVEGTGRIVESERGTEHWVGHEPDGTLAFEFAYTYDDAGRLVERHETYGDDVTVYTYAYDVDEHGSWIRLTTLEGRGDGPEPYEVVDREIAYR